MPCTPAKKRRKTDTVPCRPDPVTGRLMNLTKHEPGFLDIETLVHVGQRVA